jgi:hypothetical protein
MNSRNRLVKCLAAAALSVGLAAAIAPATSAPSADTGWGVVKSVKAQPADTGWGFTAQDTGWG